jgi:hypothetical protein
MLQKFDSDEVSDKAIFHQNGIVCITAQFGVLSHLKKSSNDRGTCQRLMCGVAWWKRSHHWTFFLSRSNRDTPFLPEHVRTLDGAKTSLWCMAEGGDSAPTFWKHCPSVFKRTLSEQVDCKMRFPSMDPKMTGLNTIGRFFWVIWGISSIRRKLQIFELCSIAHHWRQ